ncbi:putative mediator of RNA polymerase II transcription subunit 26 isoform X2 [Octopus bimaculoides]|nr:putative mediator of RNA polymerase II transcription subunit 26 isoform X2 [Octopus bimaculoides]XP_052826220.1 putative mediator of RNA polymerase II transcription subunit 26 isoform X2 [Octopus bimaculoides]XP_052826221.1 putative mediator of RNA polymerase II transcription subunit 26 isoform X2 [Octopus bimaculoides]|eukprot:XP_014777854.1 PREDICTED: putative mediator of RNA polymerase II transcription subunit 26 [Octopus bimaculoides]
MEESADLVFNSQNIMSFKSSEYDINDFLESLHQGIFQKTLQYQTCLKQLTHVFSWLLGELEENPSVIPDLTSQGILDLCSDCITIFLELSEEQKLNPLSLPVFEHILEIVIVIANTSTEIRCTLVLKFTDLLMDCILKGRLPFLIRLQALKYSNLLFERCPSSVKENLNLKPQHQNNLKSIIKLISTVGDYEFQVAIVEYTFRSISKKCRSQNLSNLSDPNIFSFINSIKDETFESDCRKCFNAFNSNQGMYQRVFSVPCNAIYFGKLKLNKPKDESYKYFWVDFNVTSQRVTFYCEQVNGSEDPECEEDVWETVSICKEDVMEIIYEVSEDDQLAIIYFLFFPSMKEILPGHTLKKGSSMKMTFQDKDAVCKGIQEIFCNPKCSVAQKAIPINDGYKKDSHQKVRVERSPYEHVLNESFNSSTMKTMRKCSVPSECMTTPLMIKVQKLKPETQNEKPAKDIKNTPRKNAIIVSEVSQSSKNTDRRRTNSPKIKNNYGVVSERNNQELKEKGKKITATMPSNSPDSNSPKTELTNTKSGQRLSAKKPALNQPLKTYEKVSSTRRSSRINIKHQDLPSPQKKATPPKSPRKLRSRTRNNKMTMSQESSSDFVTSSTAKVAGREKENMLKNTSSLKPYERSSRIKQNVGSTPVLDISNNSCKKTEQAKKIPDTRDNSALTSVENTKTNLDQSHFPVSQCGDNKSQTTTVKNTSNKTRLRSFDKLNLLPEKYPLRKDNHNKKRPENKTTSNSTATELKESNRSILNNPSICTIQETQENCAYEENSIVIPESVPLKQQPLVSRKLANSNTKQTPAFDSGIASSVDIQKQRKKTVLEKTVIKIAPSSTKDVSIREDPSFIYHSLIQKNSELKSSNIDKIKEINNDVLKEVTKVTESKQTAVENLSTADNRMKTKRPVKKTFFHFISSDSDANSNNNKTIPSKYSTITEENLKKFNQQRDKSLVNNLNARIKGFVKSSCETVFQDIDNVDKNQTMKEDEILKDPHHFSTLHKSRNLDVDLTNDKSPKTTSNTSDHNNNNNNNDNNDNDLSNKSSASSNLSSPVTDPTMRKKSPENTNQQQKVASPEKMAQSTEGDQLVNPKTAHNSSKFQTNSKHQSKTKRNIPKGSLSYFSAQPPKEAHRKSEGSRSPSFKLFEQTPPHQARHKAKRNYRSNKQANLSKLYDPYDFDNISNSSSNVKQSIRSLSPVISEKRKFFKTRQNTKASNFSNYLDITKRSKPIKESESFLPSTASKKTKQSLNKKHETSNQTSKSVTLNQTLKYVTSNQTPKSVLDEFNKDQSNETHFNLLTPGRQGLNNKQRDGSERSDKTSKKVSSISVNSKTAANNARLTRKRKPVNYKEADTSSEDQINDDESVVSSRSEASMPQKILKTVTREGQSKHKSVSPVSSEHFSSYQKQSLNSKQKAQPLSKQLNQTNKRDNQEQKKSNTNTNKIQKISVPSLSGSHFGSSITQNSEISWIAAKKNNHQENQIQKTYSTKKDKSYFGSYPCIPKSLKSRKKPVKKDSKKLKNYKVLEKELTFHDTEFTCNGSLNCLTDEEHQVLTRTTTELSHSESINKSLVSFNISEKLLPTNSVLGVHQFQPSCSSSFTAPSKATDNLQGTVDIYPRSDSSKCASLVSCVSLASHSSLTSINSKKNQFLDSPLEERILTQEEHHKLNFQENFSNYQENSSDKSEPNVSLSDHLDNFSGSNLSITSFQKNSMHQQAQMSPKQTSFWKPSLWDNFTQDKSTKINNFQALPTKTYKKSVTVSVSDESVEVLTAKVSERSSHQYSCTRESAYLPTESKSSDNCSNYKSGNIKQLVHSIGTDMKKSIAIKQTNISAITKETLAKTEKALLKVWQKDFHSRHDLHKDFESKVFREFERLHREILSSEECRQTLMKTVDEQIENSENCRFSQMKCLKRLQMLYSQYYTTVCTDNEIKKDKQVEVRNILKTEMTELQKKFLFDATQQEMQQIRSRLYKILT